MINRTKGVHRNWQIQGTEPTTLAWVSYFSQWVGLVENFKNHFQFSFRSSTSNNITEPNQNPMELDHGNEYRTKTI